LITLVCRKINNMAGGGRFYIGTEAELAAIIHEKDSASTRKSTKSAVKCFTDFLLESGRDSIDSLDFSIEELDNALKYFYFAARKTDGSLFKKDCLAKYEVRFEKDISRRKEA
jgi:hypothetical protein